MGSTCPNAALNKTGQRRAKPRERTISTAQSKSARSQTTTLTSSIGLSRSRLLQTLASTSPEPGVLMSRITRTRGSTAPVSIAPAGLEQDRLAGVGEPGHERIDFRLQQRLAAGDLDQVVAQLERLRHDRVEIEDLALGKGMRRVAVDAPQVAGRQPDEHAGQPRERALALQAAVDLMDEQGAGRLALERLEPVAMARGNRLPRQPWIGRSNHPGCDPT